MIRYFFLAATVFIFACAPKPTRVFSDSPVVVRKQSQQDKLKRGVVVLDVRAPFEFNMSHVPGAINVAWEDFSRRSPDARGLIDKDLHSITRRLALIGIDPSTSVLILGRGKAGKGEEGRVAWTLESLGVENIELAPSEAFREKKDENLPVANKAPWDAKRQPSLEVTWKELRKKIEGNSLPKAKAKKKHRPRIALPEKNENFAVIDIRSREEYSIDNLSKRTSKSFKFENIDWREFFTDEMDPNPAVMKTLSEAGITQMTEIYLISNHGVRSGAATWALQRLGYKNARNFAGGYEQIPWPPLPRR